MGFEPDIPRTGDLDESQVWFRSPRRATPRQRASAIRHAGNAMLLFRWIGERFVLPECDLPVEDTAGLTPGAAASALRGAWGYGENPLPGLVGLAESHGIRVFGLPSDCKEVGALGFMSDGIPYIAVDPGKPAERIRFDIAYEIGHLIMREATPIEPGMGSRDTGLEAQAFAMQLLMPERRVKALIPHHATVRQLLKAKSYFGVAAQSVARRAYELDRLTDGEYRSACSRITVLTHRPTEPDGTPKEQSGTFRFVAQANRQNHVPPNTVGGETGLSAQELHDLSFGNFLLVHDGGGSSTATGGNMMGRPKLELHVNERFTA